MILNACFLVACGCIAIMALSWAGVGIKVLIDAFRERKKRKSDPRMITLPERW